jgi:glutaredoxin 3
MKTTLTASADSHFISRPVLYTKKGCPWCAEAREVLERKGIAYDERSVTANADAFANMLRLSGQTKAPVLEWSGEIIADFGAAELEPFLAARVRTGELRS